MKYCPYCGNTLSDNMRFCSKCGTPYYQEENTREVQYDQQYSQPITQPKEKHVIRTILVVLGAIFAFIIISSILINMFSSSSNEYDPSETYKYAVSLYDAKKYEEALEYFDTIDENYNNTKIYKALCKGYGNYYLSNEEIKLLKQNIDFGDTKNLFLSETSLALAFLDGYWQTENKKYTLEVYHQGEYTHIETNLPHKEIKNKADGFTIEDGVYYCYKEKEEEQESEEGIEVFRFSIIGADKIAVVCLKDDSRYILIRES